MQTFILIDGNAMVHRAYHALPPLTAVDGQTVNAVYGFFSMFFKLLSDYKPAYIAVCFDRPKPTFRQTLFVGYQQHRPSMSDDLSSQFPIIYGILEKMRVQMFAVDGYEADDLIGTLATKIVQLSDDSQSDSQFSSHKDRKTEKQSNHNTKTDNRELITEVIIVSADRDLLQLVNSHVKMLAPLTGITKMVLYDAKIVEEKFGVKPSQIIDYKALVGDASDGYPGVSGIGPKTASQLLQKYETFENLYQHIGELPAKLMGQLTKDAEQAALAKKLATIVIDAPITLHCEQCVVTGFDFTAARAEFERLGMKSLASRLSTFPELTKKEKRKEETPSDQLPLIE